MGSFPVAIPDIASRAEYVRSQLETLRVSTLSDKIFFWKIVILKRNFWKERLGVEKSLPIKLVTYINIICKHIQITQITVIAL